MANVEVVMIKTEEIDFDPENPRFYRLNKSQSEDAVIEEMLDDEGAQDLMLSIGQKGYFPGEPLLVIKEQSGRYTVIEGNRRLAAVKLLNGQVLPPTRRKTSIATIITEAIEKPPFELPCLVYKTRKEILRYLGYRHITGIKEWDSLSKAKYLAQLRDEFYNGVEQQKQLKALAKDIGSKPGYVGQLLTGLAIYLRAEDSKFFGLNLEPKDIEFTYITTALGYKKIHEWLGLQGSTDIEIAGLVEENLKFAYAWMFIKDQQGQTILGETRKLDELAAVVASDDARTVLMETGNLAEAYLYTEGPQASLENALDSAIKNVKVVWSMILKISPLTTSHQALAEKLFEDVKSIRNVIRDKLED
ncbi:ParB N-terminal domain-containing protein [Methylotenera sp. L2L1]|uniref:ParB N-terminal domain-containing protein n=1 Tax=Methylotenera sp. L2L1 TaxID=1502770 RepID=UPI00055D3C3D|nr:ParB N-terminal domain-containing protein [Methylotenera sp. L2L1]